LELEDIYVLDCSAVSSGKNLSEFQRNVLVASIIRAMIMAQDTEYGGSRYL
jgi:hypothetical protein